jgi:hypothetical protein
LAEEVFIVLGSGLAAERVAVALFSPQAIPLLPF